MKLVLSTSNIMSGGSAAVRRYSFSKSNVELIDSLRSNFIASQEPPPTPPSPAVSSSDSQSQTSDYSSWTTEEDDTLYIPTWVPTPLSEPRSSYDITVKLFYLPGIPSTRRCTHTKEAIALVLKELGVDSIDLLILSYPGVTFDADDDGEDEYSGDDDSADSEGGNGMETIVQTWRVLESYHENGTIAHLGVAEFSADRLAQFLPQTKFRPSVDQINVKDCCVVPKGLIQYAKKEKIDLLTHNDCTDILPPGTTRELLGPGEKGAGVLAATADAEDDGAGLKGNIEPQWVIKYTAVVKDRGVIENKGYFARAQVGSCIEERLSGC